MTYRKNLLVVGIRLLVLISLFGAAFSAQTVLAQTDPPPPEPPAAQFSVLGAPAAVQIELPQQARVGEEMTVTLRGNSQNGARGFLFALQYDELGLDFYRAEIAPELKGQGFDVIEIGPVRQDGQVLYGALLCPVGDCTSTDYSQPKNPAALAAGSAPLARLHFRVAAPGAQALSVSQSQVIDGAQGPQAAQTAAPVDLARLDLTENGWINDSDVEAAIGAWQDLTAQGQCITPALAHYDVDGSGCIDLPDFEMILSHWGEPVNSVQADGSQAPAASITAVNAPLTLTVNDAGDGADANPGDGVCATSGGRCTLRAAIQESNASIGADTIRFDVRASGGACPSLVTIQPVTSLIIDDARGYGLTLDGYSQCGASANTGAVAGNASIKVEVKGNQTAGIYGLFINSQNNTIRGLALYNFNYQILLRGGRSHHNRIEGNFIGTNPDNTHTTNFAGENDGMRLDRNANTNTIGGNTPDKRNLVSGNDKDGIGFQGSGVRDNIAIGNYVGLKQDGVTRLRNSSDGFDIAEGAYNNRVGGLNPGERNVIAGNNGDGIEISHSNAHDNVIQGNFIGLNATGSGITRNNERGITHEDQVVNTLVERNIIVGNGGHGIRVYTANDNDIKDNFIGVYPRGLTYNSVVPDPSNVSFSNLVNAPNGQLSNGSGKSGIEVTGGSQHTYIFGNVIANHPQYGVLIDASKGYLAIGTCQAYYNTISENSIFDNGQKGIRLNSSTCDGATYYGNQNQAKPNIRSATTSQVSGTACANCVVEIFIADKTVVNAPSDNNGEGKQFVARGTASSSGSFTIAISGVAQGAILTATATSQSGNTSEFARNVQVASAGAGAADETLADFRYYLPAIIR